jgi:uncharacterized membrane protein
MAKPGLAEKGAQFVKHVVPAVIKPLHSLWNQVIGLLFISFAVMAAFSGIRAWRDFAGDAQSLFRVILSAIFSLIMAGYGISSFRRARKISRS